MNVSLSVTANVGRHPLIDVDASLNRTRLVDLHLSPSVAYLAVGGGTFRKPLLRLSWANARIRDRKAAARVRAAQAGTEVAS